MPVARKAYQALANLSLSRASRDPRGERLADMVHAGETDVMLTDEEAHGFMDRRRHRVPVIRPMSEAGGAAPTIRARDLFGQRAPAAAFGAREDPPGASTITVNEDVPDPADPRNAPEANDPQTDLSVDPDASKDK